MRLFSKAFVRVPLLPINQLQRIKSIEELLAFFRSPKMQKALFIASKDLATACLKPGPPTPKLVNSLTKYLQRASTRCTPFGVFASCSCVPISHSAPNHSFNYEFKEEWNVNVEVLQGLATYLAGLIEFQPKLNLYSNPTLAKHSGKIRYTARLVDQLSAFEVSEVESEAILDEIIQLSSEGISYSNLLKLLKEKSVSEIDARRYLADLIGTHLLLTNFDVGFSRIQYIADISAILEKETSEKLESLKKIFKVFSSIQTRPAISIDEIIDFENHLKTEFDKLGVEPKTKNFFCVNLFRESNFRISEKLGIETIEAIKVLARLTPSRENGKMKRFKEEFRRKYDLREIPILEVLDIENGLGSIFAQTETTSCEILEDLSVTKRTETEYFDLRWYNLDSFWLKRFFQAFRCNAEDIVIDNADLDGFPFSESHLPDTFSATLSVLEYDMLNDSHIALISNVGNASATNLIARFAEDNIQVRSLLSEIASREGTLQSDSIIAEVLHMPSGKSANVVVRPQVYDYEINVLGKSNVSPEYQIKLNDILVCVHGNSVILNSRSLGKRIIPKISSAHNFQNYPLPIYSFLGNVQIDGLKPNLALDFQFLERHFSYIPRIRYKNFILNPARWILDAIELKKNFSIEVGNLDRQIDLFKRNHKLPGKVLFVEGDNEMLVDFSNPLSVNAFVDAAKSSSKIVLKEFLFSETNSLLKDEKGSYTNEIVFSFSKDPMVTKGWQPPSRSNGLSKDSVKRTFIPGDSWIYVKIYCGHHSCERLLHVLVNPMCDSIILKSPLTKFFFVRFSDPDHHLRIRFKIDSQPIREQFRQTLTAAVNELIGDSAITRLQFDTYEREIERYSESFVEVAERIFTIDSKMCLAVVRILNVTGLETSRWKIGLFVFNVYLKLLGVNLIDLAAYLDDCATSLARDLAVSRSFDSDINRSYRKRKSEVKLIIELSAEVFPPELLLILQRFESELSSCYSDLVYIDKKQVKELTNSYIHMSMNRLFPSRQKTIELVLYSYLAKYYRSALARSDCRGNLV